jgi:hypothetical protein
MRGLALATIVTAAGAILLAAVPRGGIGLRRGIRPDRGIGQW